MLEFVNLTGAEAGKDQQTRRKVRSQAMRDFRRRQRAENDRKRASASGSPSIDSSKVRRAASDGGILWRNENTPPVTSRNSRAPSGVAIGAPTTSFMHNVDPSFAVGSWPTEQVPSTNSLYANDPYVFDTTGSLSSAQPSPAMSLAASQTQSEPADPFEAQSNLDHMFDFCKTYIHWLCPGIDATTAAEVLTSREDVRKSPTVLAALCLASVGHLDAVKYTEIAFDCAAYKARVYKDITERMRISSTAVSDETVGCLACLLSFEMSTGSKASVLHLHGLKSIIELKGGMHTFNEPMVMMLECLDICHSLMFETEPVYTSPDAASLPAGATGLNSRFEAAHAIMNLLKVESMDYAREHAETDPYRRRTVFVSRLVDSVKEMLTFYELNGWQGNHFDRDLAHRWRHMLDEARILGLEADPIVSDAHYLARIVYLRWLLVYNLSVHPLPPEHPNNQAVVDGIWDTAWKISEQAWSGLPYLRLWILISGAVNTTDQAKKSFFQAHLMRCAFQMGVSEWRRVKTFMLRFLASRTLRPANTQVTPPMSMPAQPSIQAPTPIRYQPADASLFGYAAQHDAENLSLAVQFMQPDRSSSAPIPQPIALHGLAPSVVGSMQYDPSQTASYTGSGLNTTSGYEELSLAGFSGREGNFEHLGSLNDFTQPAFWNLDDQI